MGEWKAAENFAKLRKPVNKDKWSMEPAVVNAFYDPNKNDIGMLDSSIYSYYY
jgi:membrane metallo-endopeptidase-like protein 1